MTRWSLLSERLAQLLELEHPPVAVSFDDGAAASVDAQPAGCCFWAAAEAGPIATSAADHAGCSVGSYTHGFLTLEQAARAEDVGALVSAGWVGADDLPGLPALDAPPATIIYAPLKVADDPRLVLVRCSPRSLMTLQGACPDVRLVGKPQCQIVPLAAGGEAVVSPGCAVSRARTGLPPGELTCALPAERLAEIVSALERSADADRAVAAYAAAD